MLANNTEDAANCKRENQTMIVRIMTIFLKGRAWCAE